MFPPLEKYMLQNVKPTSPQHDFCNGGNIIFTTMAFTHVGAKSDENWVFCLSPQKNAVMPQSLTVLIVPVNDLLLC